MTVKRSKGILDPSLALCLGIAVIFTVLATSLAAIFLAKFLFVAF